MSSRVNLLQAILSSPRTVFNVQSLILLTGSDDSQRLTKSLHYYVNDGKILNPRRGIYTKLKYNEQEMACSLFRPSYISLEYILAQAGVVFQWDETISSVSYLSRQVEIANKQYLFRKINPELWIGMEGIEQRDNVAVASAERAFLDMVYLSAGNCYFDNLRPLSITRIRELLPLYRSQKLNERVAGLLNINL